MSDDIGAPTGRASGPLLEFNLDEPDVLSVQFDLFDAYELLPQPAQATAQTRRESTAKEPHGEARRSRESASITAAWAVEGRRRATPLEQRYRATVESWLRCGYRASSLAVGRLAGCFNERRQSMRARLRTVKALLPALGTRAHLHNAWPAAARGSAKTRAKILRMSRENPVLFTVLSYATLGAAMFVLGRLSGLPAPVKPLTEVTPVVTTLASTAAAPAAMDKRPSPVEAIASPVRPRQFALSGRSDAAVGHPTDNTRPAASPARAESSFAPTPSPRAPFRGSLAVTSSPQGAQVFVNGVAVGTTPLSLRNLPVGSRAMRIVRDGYEPWFSTIQIIANQRTRTVADLRPLRRKE